MIEQNDKHGTSDPLGVLLFDNRTKTMQFVCQSGRVFKNDPCIRSNVIGNMTLEQLRHSIGMPAIRDRNIFVFQNKIEKLSVNNTKVESIFNRKVFMATTDIETITEDMTQIERLVLKSSENQVLTDLFNDIDISRPIIGVSSFPRIIVFFHINSSIVYCYIKNEYKVSQQII